MWDPVKGLDGIQEARVEGAAVGDGAMNFSDDGEKSRHGAL